LSTCATRRSTRAISFQRKTPQDQRRIPNFVQSQFGATFGGPIKKNNWFIFGDYHTPADCGSLDVADRVQLLFDRVVTKKTPGEFRTRVIQDGVHPSLHIHYKNFDLKPYFQEGRGCRTEGTFRNPNDFAVNKGLANLPYWQKIGRQINRRLLEVERVSHNSGLSGDSIQRVVQPAVTEDSKKAPGLKFGQPRVMALLLSLTMFHHLMDGFGNHDLSQQVADLWGVTLTEYTPHQMTYDLRRLRLKGLIYRPPKTNRYFVTASGWKVARLFSRLDARVFRPAMAMFTANDAVLPFPCDRRWTVPMRNSIC
jgi:hypothetical protein